MKQFNIGDILWEYSDDDKIQYYIVINGDAVSCGVKCIRATRISGNTGLQNVGINPEEIDREDGKYYTTRLGALKRKRLAALDKCERCRKDIEDINKEIYEEEEKGKENLEKNAFEALEKLIHLDKNQKDSFIKRAIEFLLDLHSKEGI
jgi:hypothetical protein